MLVANIQAEVVCSNCAERFCENYTIDHFLEEWIRFLIPRIWLGGIIIYLCLFADGGLE